VVERIVGFCSSWVLVFDQLSGLNSSRFAHTENTPTINSSVATPIMLFAKIRLPRDGFGGGGVQVFGGVGEPGWVVELDSVVALGCVGGLTPSVAATLPPAGAEPRASPASAA
jgi:hypothetical protein